MAQLGSKLAPLSGALSPVSKTIARPGSSMAQLDADLTQAGFRRTSSSS